LANAIMTRGTIINIEALNYKAWQKQWGKSIGRGGPGMLVMALRRKAAQVGGALNEFSTRTTKFSQVCHNCGHSEKKPLKLRMHQCPCGVGPVDRDVYSAFLACNLDLASRTLDVGAARAAFAVLQCRAVAIQASNQAASVLAPTAAPSPVAKGDSCGSTAARAMPLAGERPTGTPTLQDSAMLPGAARIPAGINPPGDAPGDLLKHDGHAAMHARDVIPPKKRSRQRWADNEMQLSLFAWDTGVGAEMRR
jgi:hypothetical protein